MNPDLDTLKEALAEIHPLLEAFMDQGGNDVIADVANTLYDQIANVDESLLMMADMVPMFFDKDQIKAAIDANLGQVTAKVTPEIIESALQQQQNKPNPVRDMSEESLLKVAQVSSALMPNGLSKFSLQLAGTEDLTIEERVKRSKAAADGKAADGKTQPNKRRQSLI